MVGKGCNEVMSRGEMKDYVGGGGGGGSGSKM